MKYKYFIIIFFLATSLFSQNKNELIGKITYLSSQNIYVRFTTTNGISVGDSLFIKFNGKIVPVVKVKYLSSFSVSGKKISNIKLKKGDSVLAFIRKNNEKKFVKSKTVNKTGKGNSITNSNKRNYNSYYSDSKIDESLIYGRYSVSSYANFSDLATPDFVRWRYTLSLNANKVANSNFSFESYVSFNYRSTDWANVKNNIGRALKIYGLSLKYNFTKNTSLTLGRKINKYVTNISAVDGIQFESKIGHLNFGIIAGSRPDFTDYGLNTKLLEYGVYFSHSSTMALGHMQNSIAFFQQTNNSKIDRRFLYFQHSSNLLKKLNLFFSTEIDLYKFVNGTSQNTFNLTGLYTSVHYRFSHKINLSVSYDNRKNVIYYETYKNYTDSLLDAATRQGLRVRVNFRPIKGMFAYITYGFRFMNGDLHKTNNFSAGFSYSQLSFIKGTISASYNYLNTSYLIGNILSARYSRSVFNDLLYLTFGNRIIYYQFVSGINGLFQDILSIDLTWNILRKLFLNVTFEGAIDSTATYGRVYFNLTKRF